MFLRVPVDGKKRFFRGYFVFFTAVILAVVVAVTAGQFAFYNLINNDDGRLTFGKYAAVAEILTDEAEVYSPDTSNDKSSAFYSPLPKGTLDYIAGREIRSGEQDSDKRYRILASGKRVVSFENTSGYCGKYLKIRYGRLPENNIISLCGITRSDRHTVFAFNTAWKAPFSVRLCPGEYFGQEGFEGYSPENTAYKYLEIAFDYCTEFDFSADDLGVLFSEYSYEKSDDGILLRLYLKKQGGFYGYDVRYDVLGRLVFSFLEPPNVTRDQSYSYGYSLDGTVILLDPGHGGEKKGATVNSGGVTYNEKDINLRLAGEIEKRLCNMGAKVVMTRKSDADVSLYSRREITRNVMPDVFLSLHRNYSEYDTASGYENYLFTPWSVGLGNSLSECCGELFGISRGTRSNKAMYVTRTTQCPAVLCEDGFMTDSSELYSMLDDEKTAELADRCCKAVVEYLSGASCENPRNSVS